MADIVELDRVLRAGLPVDEETLRQWIENSDITKVRKYFNFDAAMSFAAVRNISDIIVTRYLNNNNQNQVSLHCKTKFCILLNNFALYAPVRGAVFASLDKLTSVFETSIADESKMPFESELGRMSEHVLVLLMRCTDYNLKAAAVHEFTEGHTQFAIQLLLAILLKEPPYEFDLRCNCITCIYGFTLPQTFFTPGEEIKENSCVNFTEKINFILSHMLRLHAVQVMNNVLEAPMRAKDMAPAVVRRGVSDMMRSIMNIFKFSSKDSMRWRRHVLTQTNFLQETVVMHTQSLVNTLQKQLIEVPFAVSADLLKALLLTFRFFVFATYRLHEYAVQLRGSCAFLNVIFTLPIESQLRDARLSWILMALYTSVFHFLCNINSLDRYAFPEETLAPELRSAQLVLALELFLKNGVARCGPAITEAWHRQFLENNLEWSHETENATYNRIRSVFDELLRRPQPAAVSLPIPQLPEGLGPLRLRQSGKATPMGGGEGERLVVEGGPPPPGKGAAADVEAVFRCALTGELMKNPVKSPYGHTFERDAILRWLGENGSVCPMTGRALEAGALVPDADTGARIMQQIVSQSMATQLTEEDLYNF